MRKCKELTVQVLLSIVILLPAIAEAQQTNSLAAVQQSFQKQELPFLEIYGKDLAVLMGNLKKQGNLDGYLIVEAEKKRFDGERTVPSPSDSESVLKLALTTGEPTLPPTPLTIRHDLVTYPFNLGYRIRGVPGLPCARQHRHRAGDRYRGGTGAFLGIWCQCLNLPLLRSPGAGRWQLSAPGALNNFQTLATIDV